MYDPALDPVIEAAVGNVVAGPGQEGSEGAVIEGGSQVAGPSGVGDGQRGRRGGGRIHVRKGKLKILLAKYYRYDNL